MEEQKQEKTIITYTVKDGGLIGYMYDVNQKRKGTIKHSLTFPLDKDFFDIKEFETTNEKKLSGLTSQYVIELLIEWQKNNKQ